MSGRAGKPKHRDTKHIDIHEEHTEIGLDFVFVFRLIEQAHRCTARRRCGTHKSRHHGCD